MDTYKKRLIIIVVLSLMVFISVSIFQRDEKKNVDSVYSLPMAIQEWQGNDVDYDSEMLLSWLGPKKIVFRNYGRDHIHITLYLAYYNSMKQSDLAHAPTVCYPGQGWTVKEDTIVSFPINGIQFRCNRLHVEKGQMNEIVYTWWQTSDGVFARNSEYRLNQTLKRILSPHTPALWIRISGEEVEENARNIELELQKFVSDALPLFQNYLKQ